MARFRRQTPQRSATASDDELVALAQRGDRDAFGVLYERYLPGVYGYCHRLLGEREVAEDANTEVFMRALAALPAYRPGSFRSWLFAIAHNVTADVLRQRHRTIPMAQAPEPIDPTTFEDTAMRAADWVRIERALPSLSPDQQQVIALRLAGLTAVEIGAAMGRPRNAIDGLQHRALLRLKSLVATGEAAVSNDQGGGYGG
ncbi:MAG: sigma-70 family RNA polymerase sigma factor [Thermomicrobiales bacterium]|nr:sigma-70 family RNA polymerase sigma factor [Thermomicrobiales bacterium]